MNPQLAQFILDNFSDHILQVNSDKEDNISTIFIKFKRFDGTIYENYANVYIDKDNNYVFYLQGSMFPEIAIEQDFDKYCSKVLEWAQYMKW